MDLPAESAAAIDAAAAAWAAKADRGAMTAEESARLEAWAAADPRRAGAYARALAANHYLDRAAALGPDFIARPPAASDGMGRRRFLAGLGLVGAAAGLAGLGFWLRWSQQLIVTGKGDMRRVALPEGSAITLNTDTRVLPQLDEKLRHVALLDGEALFEVARDSQRSFVVEVSGVRIEVVGTSFLARRHADGVVSVVVREGIVETRWNGTAGHQRLTAGDALRVRPDGSATATSLPQDAIERSTAWREGLIDLNGLTLADAADEFARYSRRRIQIDDAAVAAMKISGIYSTSDPEGFAKAAALSLGLSATVSGNSIRIHRH